VESGEWRVKREEWRVERCQELLKKIIGDDYIKERNKLTWDDYIKERN
jgi:hypothetical protein